MQLIEDITKNTRSNTTPWGILKAPGFILHILPLLTMTQALQSYQKSPFDFYETPPWMTYTLLREWVSFRKADLVGKYFDPCVGRGLIPRAIAETSHSLLLKPAFTSDVNPIWGADYVRDAALANTWDLWINDDHPDVEYCIANPPFKMEVMLPIIKNALGFGLGGVAILGNITFLEPCHNRADLLWETAPNLVLVLPRYQFRADKSDRVTCAWFIWDWKIKGNHYKVIPEKQIPGFFKTHLEMPSKYRLGV